MAYAPHGSYSCAVARTHKGKIKETDAQNFPRLILKTAAADEFAQDRRGRDLVGRDGDEVVEELEHAPRLVVLRNRVGDLAEDLLGEGPQHRNLVEQRRVEHDVGVLLVGEDVFLLAPAHRGPARKRRERVGAALAVVARQAPQQAVVGGGDAREVVHRHRREARDVDAELLRVGDRGREARVQPVDALDDEDRAFVERQRRVVPRAAPRDEVVARDVDALAPDQARQMVVEKLQVDGFERLVVVVAVGVARGLLAVDEVVVERDQHGVQSQHAQLDAQPFGRGGLAAAGGAGDQHHAGAARKVGVVDGVGHPGELALVERFGEFDQAAAVAREHLRIDVADGGNAHDPDPRLVLLEDAEHLLLMYVAVKRVGRRAQRKGEVEAVVVGFDVEQRDIARRGGQRAVEVTRRVVERVELAVKPRTGVQKRDLVRETLLGVAGADLGGEHALARDGQVAHGEFPHAVAELRRLVGGELVDAVDLAVEPALAHRVADVERLPRVEVLDGLLQQEPRGALVDADAGEGGDVDETDRHRGIYFVTQLLDAVVDEGCEEGVKAGREAFGDLQQWGSHRDLQFAEAVFADDFDRIVHGKVFTMFDS